MQAKFRVRLFNNMLQSNNNFYLLDLSTFKEDVDEIHSFSLTLHNNVRCVFQYRYFNRQHAILNLTSSPLYSGGSKYKIHTVVIFQEGQYNLRTQGWQMALYLHFVCSMLSRGIMQQTWHVIIE